MYKEAQKRKKFKEKSIENVKESYQENTKRRSQGTSLLLLLLSRGSSKRRSQGKSLLLSKMLLKRKIKMVGKIQKTQRKGEEKTSWEPKVRT
jgi:hypothetical protein